MPDKLTPERLRAIIEQEIFSATGDLDSQVASDRERNTDYYYGQPFGTEIEGRSQVVSLDVQDTIESMMPDLMELFGGDEDVVSFGSVGPEDEGQAEQATEYVRFVWNVDNPGFQVSHDLIKDALLHKNGVGKVWWDDSEQVSKEKLENVNTLGLMELMQDPEVEIVEQTQKEAEGEQLMAAPDGALYDLTIKRTRKKGRVRVVAIAPENFGLSKRSADLEDARFLFDRDLKTIAELIEMGFDPEQVRNLPAQREEYLDLGRQARFKNEEFEGQAGNELHVSLRQVWLYECYIRIDYDGDDLAEWRQVYMAGPAPSYTMLKWKGGADANQEVEDHPYFSLTPIRMPHKFIGRAVADLVVDVQKIKSFVQRALLDNMYGINNNRAAVSSKVDLDELLTPRPGGIVQVETDNPDVAGHIVPIVTQPLGPYAYPLLEYLDGVREGRVGVTRYNQGLDPNSLNKTATGVSQLLNRAQRRILLIARIFAETGFRVAFRKILKLLITHQDSARVVRIRRQWVQVDPRHWNAEMDVQVNVALGSGTREQQAMLARMILEIQQEIIKQQGGVNGPLVTAQNVYNSLKLFTTSAGVKYVDRHFTDPGDGPIQQQQQPNPEMVKVQAQIQADQARLQFDQQKQQVQLAMEQKRAEAEIALEWAKAQAQIQLEAYRTETELGMERGELAAKIVLRRDEARMKAMQGERDARVS